jgi:hypothetical protein
MAFKNLDFPSPPLPGILPAPEELGSLGRPNEIPNLGNIFPSLVLDITHLHGVLLVIDKLLNLLPTFARYNEKI